MQLIVMLALPEIIGAVIPVNGHDFMSMEHLGFLCENMLTYFAWKTEISLPCILCLCLVIAVFFQMDYMSGYSIITWDTNIT